MEMVSAQNLWKSFDDQEVLRGISCTVQQGEVLAIIGPSGSGKSTLLRCITQLEQVDQGHIVICGEELVKTVEGKARYGDKKTCARIGLHLGLVFQNFNLFPHFNVLRNITEAPMRVLKKAAKRPKPRPFPFWKRWAFPTRKPTIPANCPEGSSREFPLPGHWR